MNEQPERFGTERPVAGLRRHATGILQDEPTARRQAMRLGLEFVDLDREPAPRELLAELPEPLMQRLQFVPVRRTGKGLAIVTADPTDVLMIDEIEMLLGCRVQVCVGTAPAIRRALGAEPAAASAEPSPSSPGALAAPHPPGAGSQEESFTRALTKALQEMVPASLYQELQMKHAQLLVQYGAIRAYGARLHELQNALEDKSRTLETARQEAAQRQGLLEEENSQLRRRLRVAALELEGRKIEAAAFKEKIAALERLAGTVVTSESIELQFSEVLRRARSVGRMENEIDRRGSPEHAAPTPTPHPPKPTPEH